MEDHRGHGIGPFSDHVNQKSMHVSMQMYSNPVNNGEVIPEPFWTDDDDDKKL